MSNFNFTPSFYQAIKPNDFIFINVNLTKIKIWFYSSIEIQVTSDKIKIYDYSNLKCLFLCFLVSCLFLC